MLYGGSAYGFAQSSLFNWISKDEKYWQKVVDEFYTKYTGIAAWHESLVREVLDKGQLVMPTGRIYAFDRRDVAKRPWFWRSKILNYPVQGLGADVVAIGRVTAWKRLNKFKNPEYPLLMVSTVHDSLDFDVHSWYNISTVCSIIKQSIEDIPTNFERLFGVPFDLPVGCEIGYGHSLGNLKAYE